MWTVSWDAPRSRNIVGGWVGAGGVRGPRRALGLDSEGLRGRPPRESLCPALGGQKGGGQSQALAWGGDDWQELLHKADTTL